jgi:hypothetical protein
VSTDAETAIVIPPTTVRPVSDLAESAAPPAEAAPEPKPFSPYSKDKFSYQHNCETLTVDSMVVYRGFVKALQAKGDDDVGTLLANAFHPLDGVQADGVTPAYTPEEAEATFWQLVDPARQAIVAAIRKAFGFTEVLPDGSGVSEARALDIFEAFWSMQDDVKKNTATTPSS